MEILDVTFRSVLSLITLFLATRILGKKQVSQLSLFDYVIGISIGNFAAEATIDLSSGYLNGIIPVFVFAIVAYIVSFASMKSINFRRFFIGTPTILIQDGKILEKGLKKVKFDINDLLEVVRGAGYFDLSEISYAIMEVDGDVSFLPKGEYKNVTIKDMKLKKEKEGLCANVVIDSKIMKNNLENIKKDEKWLYKEIKKQGYNSLDNIILVTVDPSYKVVIYEKNRDVKPIKVLE